MLKVLARRLALSVPIVFIVATLTFFLVAFIPGSPAQFILGNTASRQEVARLNVQLGLNRPLFDQYTSWLDHALHGNLGTSFLTGESVTKVVSEALSTTLSLAILAMAFTLIVGTSLGIFAALKGGRVDRTIHSLCSLGIAIPNYWLAALLLLVFAVTFRVFPADGYVGITSSPGQWLTHLVLPVVALSLGSIGQVAFQARAATLDVLGREFIRTLQAAGISRRRILARNAAIPVMTTAGILFLFLLGGVVVIETVFNLPGMGNLMLQSVEGHDLAVVQGVVLYFTVVVVLVNLGIDLLNAWLDPRSRAR